VITNRVLEHYGIQFVADWVEFSLICMTAISGWLALLFYGVRSAVASGMPEYVSIDVFGSELRYKRSVE
jgi:hypothetical protein